MERPSPSIRLHQIQAHMPFGHTAYVPDEETRNLCANFPEADILQPFREIASSEKPRRESFELSENVPCNREQTAVYCKDLSDLSLSYPNYRMLPWANPLGDYEDSLDTGRRTKVGKALNVHSLQAGAKRSSQASEIVASQLESRYRMGNTIPFCLNPQAAYLIHHSSITGHRKRAEQELGTCVFYLNDRSHLKSLEQRLQARLEKASDVAHHNRTVAEHQKTLKVGRNDMTELLQSRSLEGRPNRGSRWVGSRGNTDDPNRDYSSDFISPDGSQSLKLERSDLTELGSGHSPKDRTPSMATLETKSRKGLTSNPDQSESSLPKLTDTKGLLTSKVSMRSLYDQAEMSVQSKPELQKNTMKYANLSWER